MRVRYGWKDEYGRFKAEWVGCGSHLSVNFWVSHFSHLPNAAVTKNPLCCFLSCQAAHARF